MTDYRALLEKTPDDFCAQIESLGHLLGSAFDNDIARSLQPGLDEEYSTFLDGIMATLESCARRQRQFVSLRCNSGSARAEAEPPSLKAALADALSRLCAYHFPSHETQTWLRELSLGWLPQEAGEASLEGAWKMAKINLQRACERLVLYYFLYAVKENFHKGHNVTAGILDRRNGRLHSYLLNDISRKRAAYDKFALMLGGEAAAEARKLAFADFERYSIMEYLNIDQGLHSYRLTDEESFKRSVAEYKARAR